jgi:hypothetical protein
MSNLSDGIFAEPLIGARHTGGGPSSGYAVTFQIGVSV